MRSKLLIIDDEKEICDFIQYLAEGYVSEIMTASNAQRALDILRENKFQLIISDINMPGMSGIDLLTHLRSSGYDYPVLFVTANDTGENMLQALRLGACDFVSKPFDTKVFMAKVAKFLEIGRRMTKFDSIFGVEEKEKLDKHKKMIGLLKVSSANKKLA